MARTKVHRGSSLRHGGSPSWRLWLGSALLLLGACGSDPAGTDSGVGGTGSGAGSGGVSTGGGGSGGVSTGGGSGEAAGGVAGVAGGPSSAAGAGGFGDAGSAGGDGLGAAGSGGDAGAGGSGDGCPGRGAITYTLARSASPSSAEADAYDRITSAMDSAVFTYNCYTDIEKRLSVSYVPSVPTADGNVNGSIRFGSTASMNSITAMHEISHTVGIGSREFAQLVVDRVFTGERATQQLRAITGNPTEQVHADGTHFWPYGLNYTSEVTSDEDLVNHCRMVVAIRTDMGL